MLKLFLFYLAIIFMLCSKTVAFAACNSLLAIFPPALKPGDTIGLIASASTVEDKNEIFQAKTNLEKMGFHVLLGRYLFNDFNISPSEQSLAQQNSIFRKEYLNITINLAGSDIDRAADIMTMFENPQVKAIIEFRGGYGSGRLLSVLNYNIIKHHPKILMGYSDITALLLAINTKTGLITFHGPIARESWDPLTKQYFIKTLMQNSKNLVLNTYYPVIDDDQNVANLQFTIHSGVASGKLIGGNLSILTSLIGSPYLPDFNHAILFIEDVNETELYQLDRLFYQLKNSGILNQLSGFIFASCYHCNLSSAGYATLMQIFNSYIKPLNIPAYAGTMIGHIGSQFTIPIGLQAQINADKYTIKFLQSATIN